MPFSKSQNDGIYRHEYKYVLDAPETQILLLRAEGVLHRDPYVQQDGAYFVHSLYFDDCSNTCFRENAAGTDPRSKFRIRYYNNDPSRLLLEKKSKCRGMTLKESCNLSREECLLLMQGHYPTVTPDMPERKQKLLLQLQLRSLQPVVIVSYRRTPFVHPAGNVRITFDSEISSSAETDRFLEGDYPVRPVLPAKEQILEVKWDALLPGHIREILSLEQLQWCPFSKYCMCRMYHL